MGTKTCSICEEEKELSEFYSQKKTRKDGTEYIYYYPYCKGCNIEKSTKRHWENRDDLLEQKRQWRQDNKKHINEYEANYKLEHEEYTLKKNLWRKNNPDKVKQYNYKYTQNKKHNISEKEWIECKEYFNYECAYCGISESVAIEKYNKGLHKEHVINEGASDLSNCIPACTGCNSSKHRNDYIDWYTPDNKAFNKDRLEKIENWLTNDYELYIQ